MELVELTCSKVKFLTKEDNFFGHVPLIDATSHFSLSQYQFLHNFLL